MSSFDDMVPQKARDEIKAADMTESTETGERKPWEYASFVPDHWVNAGLICAVCKCPVDEYVRGPHDAECPLRVNNQSLLAGAEHYRDL